MDTPLTFTPIGYFHGEAKRKYDAPRQGVFTGGSGRIVLSGGRNFEMALRDLEGFERIWLVFVFHRNGTSWRPTTRPPVGLPDQTRVGLFASRAPYRPNPIGLSAVRLLRISGRTLDVAETDLLEDTPILDIKPYIPAADAFPRARAGWVERQISDTWRVTATDAVEATARMLRAHGAPDLMREATLQLAYDPFDAACKRVCRRGAGATKGTLSLRMFRLDFTALSRTRTVTVTAIRSGYTPAELLADDDPYADKAFHRLLGAADQRRV